jgi:hypothetical protein
LGQLFVARKYTRVSDDEEEDDDKKNNNNDGSQ